MSLPRIDDDTASLPLEVGVFGAEPWTNAMREEIERRGAMHATDIYGLSDDARRTLAAQVAHTVKARIGTTVTVDVVGHEGIERSVGKVRRIIDQRER